VYDRHLGKVCGKPVFFIYLPILLLVILNIPNRGTSVFKRFRDLPGVTRWLGLTPTSPAFTRVSRVSGESRRSASGVRPSVGPSNAPRGTRVTVRRAVHHAQGSSNQRSPGISVEREP
tara:strand:+ start:3754 stop:4107 length:354 start_codon:yes stop_codon:yes gene_type:complete